MCKRSIHFRDRLTMGQAKKKQYGQSREELMMMCIGDVIQVILVPRQIKIVEILKLPVR